jgi:hypothetical protein
MSIEAVRIKEQRKRVLTNLNLFYPSPVQIATLWRTLCDDPAYEYALYRKDIIYFQQKGWIEYVDDKIGGADTFDRKVVLLTAKGKEIAEQTMTDEALEI